MHKFALLFDKKNDWLKQYLPDNLNFREDIKISSFYEEKHIKKFDVVFVLGFTRILKKDFLRANSKVFIVHESNLPLGKGFSPLQWQILEGKNKIVFSLLEAAEDFDCGDIIEQMELNLDGTELYDEIRYKQAKLTFELIIRFIKNFPNNKKRKQFGKSTYYRRREISDSELDVNLSIKELFPLLRIVNNKDWPGFFIINGIKYTIKIYKEEQNT
tara:strand:+ start:4318 stop:4962 length:645 start_codon:yes stop_codon:yes gene_type:complete